MGRKPETGLSYYPFDIDFFSDIKIRKLIKYQGGKAVTVYALLLCLIYKSGYYMRWDDELPFICSEQTGFEEAYISEVIKSCMALGLFSRELFDSEKILTSKGIQQRYETILKLCKRKSPIKEFSLISSEKKAISSEEKGISSELIPISSEEKAITSEEMPQKKRKEKEKEYKEKERQRIDGFFEYHLAPERQEWRDLLAKNYGIDDVDAAFQEFRDLIIERELSSRILTVQDFANTFRNLYCIPLARHKPPSGTVNERRKAFKESIMRTMQSVRNADGTPVYDPDMCSSFFNYWTELAADGSRMRFESETHWETEKRMKAWKRRMN